MQIELPISMGNSCNYCEQYIRASSGHKRSVNKTEQSIYECLLGFCFNNISCATNFGCIDSFLLPNSRNEEMMGDGFFWCYCCRFVLASKRLLSTSQSQASAVASSIFFMVLFPMLFEVRRIVCVEN